MQKCANHKQLKKQDNVKENNSNSVINDVLFIELPLQEIRELRALSLVNKSYTYSHEERKCLTIFLVPVLLPLWSVESNEHTCL